MKVICVAPNGHAAVRLYKERLPHRRAPHHTTFSSVSRRLRETGCLTKSKMNRERTTMTPDNEEQVLSVTEGHPSTSTRAISQQVGFSPTTVWRTLSENKMRPFHLQSVQELQSEDYPHRKTFAEWYLQQIAADNTFAASVLFTDEATFTREGAFNKHSAHIWTLANPHGTRTRAAQRRVSINVWAGILGDYLIGPYILHCRLGGRTYLIFLQHVLPELLDEAQVPLSLRRCMWFEHDGDPPHYTNAVCRHLKVTFGQRWIGRGDPVHWPARSPDLTCMNFFCWGQMKSWVYDTPVPSVEDLAARISVADEKLSGMPGIFKSVRNSMRRRCQDCRTTSGRNFEQLL